MELSKFTLNKQNYEMAAILYKEATGKEEGVVISPTVINSIVIHDDIYTPYAMISMNIDSKFGFYLERISPEDSFNDSSQQAPKPVYEFEYGGKDLVYIKIINENSSYEYANKMPPYPIIEGEFVVIKKTESEMHNIYGVPLGTTATLDLMPKQQWDLFLSYPQWTTGFDKWSAEGETDKMLDYKSGKKTGLCIKELLEKCGAKIDEENFDLTGPNINCTSLVGNNVLDTINYILDFHHCENPNGSPIKNDPCFFRYDSIKNLHTLEPISKFFTFDQEQDEIGTYEKIRLQSFADKKQLRTDYPAIGASFSFYTESSLDGIMLNNPRATTARHKSTFVIDARQYNTKETEQHIQNGYYNDPSYGETYDKAKISAPFDKDITYPPIINKTVHWRENERNRLNRNLLLKKILFSQAIEIKTAGVGGGRQVGRRFLITQNGGAIDPFTKRILGIYLTTELDSIISPKYMFYDNIIKGVKVLQADSSGKTSMVDSAV